MCNIDRCERGSIIWYQQSRKTNHSFNKNICIETVRNMGYAHCLRFAQICHWFSNRYSIRFVSYPMCDILHVLVTRLIAPHFFFLFIPSNPNQIYKNCHRTYVGTYAFVQLKEEFNHRNRASIITYFKIATPFTKFGRFQYS